MDKLIIIYAWIAVLLYNLTYLSGLYAFLFRQRNVAPIKKAAGKLTIIRPIFGLDTENVKKNQAILNQDYSDIEVVIVAETGDTTTNTEFINYPNVKYMIVSTEGGLSPKVVKMAYAWERTQSEFVAFADSDIQIPHDLVSKMIKEFENPQVAGISCPCLTTMDGLVGKICMQTLSYDYMPVAYIGINLHHMEFMQGAFMMVRRSVIDEAGGVEQLRVSFADDLRLGKLVESTGHKIRMMPDMLIHSCKGESPAQLLQRYHRWEIAQKLEFPQKIFTDIFFNPTVIPLILSQISPSLSTGFVASAISIRIIIAIVCDYFIVRKLAEYSILNSLLRPVGDMLHFIMALKAVFSKRAMWRGRLYSVSFRGKIKQRLT